MKSPLLPNMVALLVFSLVCGVAVAQGTDPESVIRAYIAALNRGDVDSAAAYLVDDVVRMTSPPAPGTNGVDAGKAQIRKSLEGFVQNQNRSEIRDLQVVGDTVKFIGRVSGPTIERQGTDSLEYHTEVVVQEGKIQSISGTLTAESGAKLQAARARAMAGPLPRSGESTLPLVAISGLSVLALLLGLSVRRLRRIA